MFASLSGTPLVLEVAESSDLENVNAISDVPMVFKDGRLCHEKPTS